MVYHFTSLLCSDWYSLQFVFLHKNGILKTYPEEHLHTEVNQVELVLADAKCPNDKLTAQHNSAHDTATTETSIPVQRS